MPAVKHTAVRQRGVPEKLSQLNLEETAEQLNTDVYTLQDMIEAISQPLRDYREQFDGPMLRHDVLTLEDLHPGDELEGVSATL